MAPIEEFLSFIISNRSDGAIDLAHLTKEWRDANARVEAMARGDQGAADAMTVTQVSEKLEDLVKRVTTDPMFQRSFAAAPAHVGMVELDRLVVFQKNINLAYVDELKGRLGDDPRPEDIFGFCLPFEHPRPDAVSRRVPPGNAHVFSSCSNDPRFLEAQFLQPEQISGYDAPGPLAGVLALFIGFSSNYCWALQADRRLILHNGSHRFYALRDLGHTHAPCVVQRLNHAAELSLVGSEELKQNPPLFLQSPRPPMLKDYFNADLIRHLPVPRTQRQVKVTFGHEAADVPVA